MKALDPNDQLFLFIERRQQPMHVAALQLFTMPDDADENYFLRLVEQMRAYRRPTAPFDKRLSTRFGLPFWEHDTELDLDLHLRHEALPHPGRIRELLALVSAEHSIQLDRERPLWESHVVEGLSNRQFALYTKVHHSLMDGISAMRLAMQCLSTDPNERDRAPFWAQPRVKRPRPDADATPAHYLRTAAQHASALPSIVREAIKQSLHAQRNPEGVSIYSAPHCLLSERITGSRRVAAQSYSMSRIQAIANVFDATINDVVLAMCGSALRHYLASQGALPDRPLVAMVPMSMRRDDSTGGNLFAVILANLGTHLRDPVSRMRVIRESVQEAKTRYRQMTPTEAMDYSALTLAPVLFNLFTGLRPKWLSYNVVISNVPGPRVPLYMNGARLEGFYPVSIVLDHNALNITLTSYGDSLQFGVVGCRRTLPSMQRVLDYLERGIWELEVAAGLASAVRSRDRHEQPLVLYA